MDPKFLWINYPNLLYIRFPRTKITRNRAMNVDLSGIGDELKDMLADVVNDVTDPHIQQFITELLDDYATLGMMKADDTTDPGLIAEAEQTLKARAESLAAIPGLIAADKREAFFGIVNRISNVVVGTVFGVARAYLGLPPTTDQPTATT